MLQSHLICMKFRYYWIVSIMEGFLRRGSGWTDVRLKGQDSSGEWPCSHRPSGSGFSAHFSQFPGEIVQVNWIWPLLLLATKNWWVHQFAMFFHHPGSGFWHGLWTAQAVGAQPGRHLLPAFLLRHSQASRWEITWRFLKDAAESRERWGWTGAWHNLQPQIFPHLLLWGLWRDLETSDPVWMEDNSVSRDSSLVQETELTSFFRHPDASAYSMLAAGPQTLNCGRPDEWTKHPGASLSTEQPETCPTLLPRVAWWTGASGAHR